MADIYVRSTDGVNTDSGATWPLAKADATGAAAIDAAGDNIYFSQAHSESTAAAITIALAGTLNSPTKFVCVNDGAQPPTTVSLGAIIATTLASNITITGSAYIGGINFIVGSGTGASVFIGAINDGDNQIYDGCTFNMNTTGAGSELRFGSTAAGFESAVVWRNCNLQFSNVGHAINLRGVHFRWIGGSANVDVSPTNLIEQAANGIGEFLIEGVDFSAFSALLNLVDVSGAGSFRGIFRNCRMPVSWSGQVTNGSPACGGRIEFHNTNYMCVEDHRGRFTSYAFIYRTGGASNGIAPLSWLAEGNGDCAHPQAPLFSPEIHRWNETTGVSMTATVEIVTDGVTLTDAQAWIELHWLDSDMKSHIITDSRLSLLATPTAQASSSAAWTTSGMVSPIKQKLSVTFTPSQKGVVIARVGIGTSTQFWIDPVLTLT